MRRFLAAWGPPLFATVLVASSVSGATWCVLGSHWLAVPFPLIAAVVALIASLVDLEEGGPSRRRTKVACSSCYVKELDLAAVTKDRDELREALATLQLEPASNDKGRAL